MEVSNPYNNNHFHEIWSLWTCSNSALQQDWLSLVSKRGFLLRKLLLLHIWVPTTTFLFQLSLYAEGRKLVKIIPRRLELLPEEVVKLIFVLFLSEIKIFWTTFLIVITLPCHSSTLFAFSVISFTFAFAMQRATKITIQSLEVPTSWHHKHNI